jgi:hypothetical protein
MMIPCISTSPHVIRISGESVIVVRGLWTAILLIDVVKNYKQRVGQTGAKTQRPLCE